MKTETMRCFYVYPEEHVFAGQRCPQSVPGHTDYHTPVLAPQGLAEDASSIGAPKESRPVTPESYCLYVFPYGHELAGQRCTQRDEGATHDKTKHLGVACVSTPERCSYHEVAAVGRISARLDTYRLGWANGFSYWVSVPRDILAVLLAEHDERATEQLAPSRTERTEPE